MDQPKTPRSSFEVGGLNFRPLDRTGSASTSKYIAQPHDDEDAPLLLERTSTVSEENEPNRTVSAAPVIDGGTLPQVRELLLSSYLIMQYAFQEKYKFV